MRALSEKLSAYFMECDEQMCLNTRKNFAIWKMKNER